MSDNLYYAQRAVEERRLAMASADSKIREIHLEMASKYDLLAANRTTEQAAEKLEHARTNAA